MFLGIDIGNTHTVIGIYQNDRLVADWRLSSNHRPIVKTIGKKLESLLYQDGIYAKDVNGVGISSVVPHLTDVYAAISKSKFHRKPLVVQASLNLGIHIYYDDPNSLGADRICNTIAAYTKYGGPLIIIDLGTATTYDIVASNGDFLGGVIAPGIETSAYDLYQRTSQLPKIDLHLPDKIIGSNTKNSMQTGILISAIDSVEGMVQRIQKELRKRNSKKAVVVATGGFSKFMSDHSKVIQHVEASLVLDGIRLIYERVHRKKNKLKS